MPQREEAHLTEAAVFRASGCPQESTGQGWGERGLAAE